MGERAFCDGGFLRNPCPRRAGKFCDLCAARKDLETALGLLREDEDGDRTCCSRAAGNDDGAVCSYEERCWEHRMRDLLAAHPLGPSGT